MDQYDPSAALDQLREEAILPNPALVRDLILRTRHNPEQALELNRRFQAYQRAFAEAQGLATGLLEEIAQAPQRS